MNRVASDEPPTCFSEKSVSLYEGNRYQIFPLELKNVPTNIYQVSGMRLGSEVDSKLDLHESQKQASEGAGSYVEPWLYRVCIRAGGSPENCSDDANAHP